MSLFKTIKFNRQELSGAFGDIGTDLPLIIAMVLAAKLHVPSVLILFGAMQIFTGLVYKMPMPVQPLKAMATLVIAQQIAGPVLLGAGLAIGVVMLVLSVSGLLDKLADLVPKAVVRGIQLGLGISLCSLAAKQYIPADKEPGYLIALVSFILVMLFIDNKKYPASLLVISLGFVYALIFKIDATTIIHAAGLNFPQPYLPTIDNITKGFLLLALPQIPLSLGNSIIATRQVAQDFFPERPPLSITKIGITYSLMNLTVPFFSGLPCCHGSGGMVGHYTFGGRTGGSVILYGLLFIVLGLFFGNGFESVVQVFPMPMLGVILLFEGASLMMLVKDIVSDRKGFAVAILTGAIAFGLQYGFIISIIVGTLIYYAPLKMQTWTGTGNKPDCS